MKKVIFTLWILPVGLIVFGTFGANKQQRRNPRQQPAITRAANVISSPVERVASVETADDRNSRIIAAFGGTKSSESTESASNEDFWKIFGAGLSEQFNEPEKKIAQQDALAIVDAMNKVSDTFNQDYSFTELSPTLFMSKLTLFLGNPKNQPILKKISQLLKDNIASFPENLSNTAVSMEESINKRNAEQFYSIYSALEYYFRGLPTKPLVKVGKLGWGATLRSITDAVTSRARRAYNYLFSRKSIVPAEHETPHVITKYIIQQDDSAGNKVTKHITEIEHPGGKTVMQEIKF